jgi:GMP synthase (glutamine-hydrolysing)
MTNIHEDRVLILDFGSQYTQLIARRVREANVYCEIHPFDMDVDALLSFKPRAIILSGGPDTVTVGNGIRAPERIFTMEVPILGICYGMQTMAVQMGGKVAASALREYGHAQVRARGHSELLRDIQDETNAQGHGLLNVWMSHGDRVDELPPGFSVIASTENAPIAAMADEERRFYGLQFHPEVTHTRQGTAILQRFLHDIAGCRPLWTMANIIQESVRQIRSRVGTDEVLLALSGGVDSSVVAALLHQAIGDQLTCIFVDNGLLRLNEGDQVMETFARHMGIRVIRVDAADQFMQALAGEADPEAKRKIIGRQFIKVFEAEAKKLKNEKWLAQGTIYPDVIESAGAKTGKAQVIKSHHNVAGLPDIMQLELIEPLRELFKDEVRKLGVELDLPEEMVYRHPFPGPGLGVRILGEVKQQYADILRQADNIFISALREHDLYHRVSQAFAVFLPVKSVGVKGDARYYEYVIALRAVETIDFMTARWAHLPYTFLEEVSNRILNEVSGLSRVTYDISGKPPATIEWE